VRFEENILKNMKMTTGFTDTPITTSGSDTLEVRHYIESLAGFILKCETPLTISIQGEWGTGKTSAMNIIKESLDREKIPTVWFNTWQFSQFSMQDYLAISMLNSLTNALGNPPEVKSALEKVWSVCSGAGLMALKGASMMAVERIAGGTLTGRVFGDEQVEDKDSSPLTLADDIMRLKANLAAGVAARLESVKSNRLVVFIDDLDRLEPRRAVELLEVLKNFLDVPGCVFVLAVDHSVVEQGIKAKFGLERIDRKGRSFFDKIIQLSFNLPVAQYNTQKYIRGLIEQIGIAFDGEGGDVESYARLVAASVGFNPRGMKRIFNLFQLLATMAESTAFLHPVEGISEARKQLILFGLLCLQTGFPELYLHLALQRDKLGPLEVAILAQERGDEDYQVSPLDEPDIDREERIEQMREFMAVFISVLDLDGNGMLSDSEVSCLRCLLAFSALTSHEGVDPIRRREKFSSFQALREHLADRGMDRSLALSIYEALDEKLDQYAVAKQLGYTRNITANAVVTYSVERNGKSNVKGRRAVVFLYSYAQASGVALHLGRETKLQLRAQAEVTDELVRKLFENYEIVAAEASG